MYRRIQQTTALVAATALLLLGGVAGAAAQDTSPASSSSLTIGGFVSATLYAQNQLFGLFTQGQAANTGPTPAEELTEDGWFHGGDVRNTRLSLRFVRQQANDWTTGATFEIDLFGGFAGTEPFGDEMPVPRLRLAYVDLSNGTTRIRVGQMWSPSFGGVPNSLSHIAFPLGYGSGGLIGWRFPGVSVLHTLNEGDGATTSSFEVALLAGSWSHLIPNTPADEPGLGESDLFPQIEARLNMAGEADFGPWSAYLVGHIDRKDMDGIGVDGDADPLVGTAVEVGGQVVPGPVTLHGNVYYGQAIGQLLGSLTQIGDYVGVGGWAQVGYALSPRVSVWAFGAVEDAQDGGTPLPDGARDQNRILAGMLRYDLPGYAVGLEWLRASTDFVGVTESTSANQIALSVFYAF